jgi:rhodanese-related sulfurtransferase
LAQRELARIGIDRPASAATGRPETWAGERGVASLRVVTFGDLATAFADGDGDRPLVLDVRRRLEWDEGHIAGAVHIPLHELAGRLDELADGPAEQPGRADGPPGQPDGQPGRPGGVPGRADGPPVRRAGIPRGEVWVHCGAGYRSMVAASILAARGRRVVAVNDDFSNAAAAGLPVEPA